MSYIKIFENFNKLYTEIDIETYTFKLQNSEQYKLTEKEFISIKKDLSNRYQLQFDNAPIYHYFINTYSIVSIRNFLEVRICKLDDEWYYISHYYFSARGNIITKYYKCDTFEGLLLYLKDKYYFRHGYSRLPV